VLISSEQVVGLFSHVSRVSCSCILFAVNVSVMLMLIPVSHQCVNSSNMFCCISCHVTLKSHKRTVTHVIRRAPELYF
jgi:hypothetical protein